MLFILTYFHVYWRIIVLKGIYMKHMEMESKCTTRKAQPAAYNTKSVARGPALVRPH
jgi:hypothetical protein